MTGFKNFILRGNLVELAVAFIMAAGVRRGGHGHRRADHGPDRQGRRQARLLQLQPGGLSSAPGSPRVISFLIMAAVVYFLDRDALHQGQGALLPQPGAGHARGRRAARGDPRPAPARQGST